MVLVVCDIRLGESEKCDARGLSGGKGGTAQRVSVGVGSKIELPDTEGLVVVAFKFSEVGHMLIGREQARRDDQSLGKQSAGVSAVASARSASNARQSMTVEKLCFANGAIQIIKTTGFKVYSG